ncbi:transglycosylase SLT domain-containing protein [Marispirochaeta sp.]|jgi:hypothetical protein|uniref:transglycosylase SLT domain-containing protein n=1 Tax=Marispirochaeta sp. TaxID=2038653 RepID=UPI0029C7EC82|nr:transglycosylase SLT domain-containing protein [Marispirochaeta sp.]
MNGIRVIGIFSVLALIIPLLAFLFVQDGVTEDEMPRYIETAIHLGPEQDIGLELYRRPESRQQVIDFYSQVTGSREIAELILHYSNRFEVPPSLSFSLVYAESNFRTRAVNRNSHSIDRGLFQLNNRSFPELTEADFFDPVINTRHGVAYLRYCLDEGKNLIVALAMYNAGRTRVTERGAPRMTLDYIAKILDYQSDLEGRFENGLISKQQLVKTDAKSGKRIAYVLDKSKTVK